MTPYIRHVVTASFLFGGMIALSASAVATVRLQPLQVVINVSVDDKHLLRGHGRDAVLSEAPLGPGSAGIVAPDADNPLKATVRGKIVVQVAVTKGSPWVLHTELKELRLLRDKPEDPWRFHPDDAARIEKDTDIKKIFSEAVAEEEKRKQAEAAQPATPQETNPWPWVAGGGIALVAVLALGFVVATRRKPNSAA